MLERDYTKDLVKEAENVGANCYRFGDTGMKTRNKVPFDNIVWFSDYKFAFVEMKIKNKPLTENELLFAPKYDNYFICRVFPSEIKIYIMKESEIYLASANSLQDMVLKIKELLNEKEI